MGAIFNSLNILNVHAVWQRVFQGFVIILAHIFNYFVQVEESE